MARIDSFGTLLVVDVGPLLAPRPDGVAAVARQIEAACRDHGFFYVTGHGVAPELLTRLERACAAFTGTYGDYLLGQVSTVFPQLRRQVLTDEAP